MGKLKNLLAFKIRDIYSWHKIWKMFGKRIYISTIDSGKNEVKQLPRRSMKYLQAAKNRSKV